VSEWLLDEYVDAGLQGTDDIFLVEPVWRRDDDGVDVFEHLRHVLEHIGVVSRREVLARVGVDIGTSSDCGTEIADFVGVKMCNVTEPDESESDICEVIHRCSGRSDTPT